MSKAHDDLLEVRALFEEFERKMAANAEQSIAKRGLSETLSVQADIAKIRAELHDLHLKMFPPAQPDAPSADDLVAQGYM